MDKNYTVAITGASGSIYGIRFVEELLKTGCHVNLVISETGKDVLLHETGIDLHGTEEETSKKVLKYFKKKASITFFDNSNLFASVSSGSYKSDGMIIAPCSMGALGRIASGHSQKLIERTADVMLKEKRRLILVPRETPLNQIHLENMLKLSKMNADIVPAMPAFYQKPKTMDDLVNFVVGKVLDLLRIEHNLFERWKS
ncbi:MAG: flavin prenyltransferase UbiX [Deltaproteobacteria bacterium]|nr:flavin prenyltransferase UbiX [Deltaproteobacteria bacterium]